MYKGITNINYSTIISIICTVITSILAYLTYKNNIGNKTRDSIADEVKRDTAISTKLDMVISGNNDLKDEIRDINEKLDTVTERIAKCEEQTKNASVRIEKIENKIN